ncbi:DNA recombination protein RmuC [Microbacterium keratanolyticum]|uniref:DNA recombination protein RmuC n=1 Tax=Microbacterium keratanolyticum TaxID=67574 RepID=A0A9W6HTM5_9MICO|nr:DNA recombination protein RmuC [Microbacterium keratanolyticum]MBM7469843.1 DNA recombination protein RmuC [Microbacterium keratanolyticum]GLK01924.1 DNA recombination protein RmuC [Microbacterium keratanolyticum]
METLTTLLGITTVILLIVVLVLVLALRGKVSASSAAGGDSLGAETRAELSAQRMELKETIMTGQSLLDQRVMGQAQVQAESQERDRVARREEQRALQESLSHALTGMLERIHALTETNAVRHGEMQTLLRDELEKMRTGNEAKLEKMRETVDEKLQGTLEKRLGESFALVSDRLEQVQKGLGEMQTLASDVGGLKRVLTNVKNRGSWGEVQLSRQLEDMLSPEQYAENVAVRPGSSERVEFAIRLPGRDDDQPVWLPIDSKFPQEDYERLLEAQERGDKNEIDVQSKNIERVILAQAKLIADKYVEPPYSTDFAIMYLPTEGLFAEVVRRPGLTSRLQNEFHITVAGPSVLMTLLNSLQMGFRTLAIEKRSSEVWKVLSAAKVEFQKYGQVWEKLGKQLQTAQNTVSEAGRRTRAVERRLRDVEVLDAIESDDLYDLHAEIGDVRLRLDDAEVTEAREV